MFRRIPLAWLVALLLLTGCAMLEDPPWEKNPACERVGSAAASDALGRKVQAEPGSEGFYDACEYYPEGADKVLAALHLYQDEAQRRFDEDRAAEAAKPTFREENVGFPAYSIISRDVVETAGIDGSSYLVVWVFIDRFGGSPEDARQAAAKLLEKSGSP